MPEKYDFAELLINIHNKSSPPYDLENGGFWLKPGSFNYFQVDRVFTEQLDEPYNNCLKNYDKVDSNKKIIEIIKSLNRTYSHLDCYRFCSYLFALEKSNCNCNSTLFYFQKDCTKRFYENDTDTFQ